MDELDQMDQDALDNMRMREAHAQQEAEAQQAQLYPLSYATHPLAQVPATQPPAVPTPAPSSLLTMPIGPLPLWGWGAIALLGGGAWYLYSKSSKVSKNDGDGSGTGYVSPNGSSDGGGRFETSRSGFASKLRGYLQKNGHADAVVFDPKDPRRTGSIVIYGDADDAKKHKLKHVSPLVTMQCKGGRLKLADLDRFAKREGLSAVEHESDIVGFYPGGGRKGKAWEEYVDALRDDGQTV